MMLHIKKKGVYLYSKNFQKEFHLNNDLSKNGFCDLRKVKNQAQVSKKRPDALFLNCLGFSG